MDFWFDLRGEAIRDYIKGDKIEKSNVLQDHPDLADKSLLLSAINSGLGDLKTCKEMIEKLGSEYIAELIRIQQIGVEINGD